MHKSRENRGRDIIVPRVHIRENDSQRLIARVLVLSMATLVHTHARNLSSVAIGLIPYDIATWTVVLPVSELPLYPYLSRDENVSRDMTRRPVAVIGRFPRFPVHPTLPCVPCQR